jgi:hypothetical protein
MMLLTIIIIIIIHHVVMDGWIDHHHESVFSFGQNLFFSLPKIWEFFVFLV